MDNDKQQNILFSIFVLKNIFLKDIVNLIFPMIYNKPPLVHPICVEFQTKNIKCTEFMTGPRGSALYKPHGLVIAGNGDILITEPISNRIAIFTDSGVFKDYIGNEGNGKAEFKYPVSLALDKNEYLYVVDQNNHRVQKFNKKYEYILEFGGRGKGFNLNPGQFMYPNSIAICSEDRIYVSDKSRVSIFDSNGNYITIIDKEINTPGGIVVDNNKFIYIVNYFDGRAVINKYDNLGIFIGRIGKFYQHFNDDTYITIDKNNLIIANACDGIYMCNNDKLISDFVPECINWRNISISGIAFTKFGELVVSCPNGNLIRIFGLRGEF
jgi:hypothetical protein